ncbi:SPOR domain-containing protein [Thalassobaculum sp.]|uniref:SPOR domain-containing protein n=1 Tax=Thalassobaculum sp. TaxID=2022740 RepID=UPI0032EFFC18
MKRNLVVALMPLALGGCLPLPITIATTAFSGISYLTSGKSTTDHVLSATMEQDCALTRPVFGEPFCRDVGPDGEGRTPSVTVASYPGDRDGVTDEARIAALHHGALDLSGVDGDVQQIAIAPRFLAPPPRVSVAGIIVTKDQIIPAPQTRALPIAADASWSDLVPVKTIEVAPLAAPEPLAAPATASASGSPALRDAASQDAATQAVVPKAPAPRPVASSAPKRVAAVAIAPTAVVAAAGDADRWVVLGSFRDPERARVMASRFAGHDPSILEATVEGGQWHRVAIGPLTGGQARQVRDGLGRVDGQRPWVVRTAAR